MSENYYVRENPLYREVMFLSGKPAQASELNDLQYIIRQDDSYIIKSIFNVGPTTDITDKIKIDSQDVFLPEFIFSDGVKLYRVGSITAPAVTNETWGILISEQIVDSTDDPLLRSQASGSISYNQTGASRLKIVVTWSSTPNSLAEGSKFFPLLTLCDSIPRFSYLKDRGQLAGTSLTLSSKSVPLSVLAGASPNSFVGCSTTGVVEYLPIGSLINSLGLNDVQYKDNLTQSIAGTSDSYNMYPSVNAVRNYVESRVTGTIKWCGIISSMQFPLSGGTGVGGGVQVGNAWTVSIHGTLDNKELFLSDTLVAKKDSPLSSWSDWEVIPGGIDYSPQNEADRVVSLSISSTDSQYPSAKLLYTLIEELRKDLVPPGVIQFYPNLTPPSGWLIANGAVVSRVIYSRLFEVLGTSYGAGDGSSTFQLPYLLGRSPMGYLPDTPYGSIGSLYGEYTCTLNGDQIPPHTHSIPMTPSNRSDGNHDYSMYDRNGSMQSGSFGAGQPHNNLHPVTILLPIIKY